MVIEESGSIKTSLVGRRVAVGDERATVLFEGTVGDTAGTWLGVEWDNPSRGKHNGTHEGVSYFTPRRSNAVQCCSFLRHNKVSWGQTITAGAEERYGRVEGDTAGVEVETIANLQRETGARFVEVVGFDKVNSQQSQLNNLITISLIGKNISDEKVDLSEKLTSLRDLDLSENLLSSWDRLSQIGATIPLRTLDVTTNVMEIDAAPNLLADRFAHLTHLILGNMGYDWTQVEQIAGRLPALEILQAHTNKITSITVGEGMFPKLKELELDCNQINDWADINSLNAIENLQQLRINDNPLKAVKLESDMFPKLTVLHMSNNMFETWESIAELNKIGVVDLRFRNCPVYNREQDEERARQMTVAMVASVRVMNGSAVVEAERRWAEIDYLKRYGDEWLRIQRLENTEEKSGQLKAFTTVHPRFATIVEKFGDPEEGENRKMETSIKATLVPVKIRCPDLPGSADTVKKLPLSMTIGKVKALLHRLFKKNLNGADMRLSLLSGSSPNHEQILDNDLRELTYYSVEKDDIILVRW